MSLKFLLDATSVPRYPRSSHHHPPRSPEEARMGASRSGSTNPIQLTEYHDARNELAGLPVTSAEKIPVTNTPNIFSHKAYVFAKNPALVPRLIKATKADVGGVGGHVVAAEEVKSIIAKFVLENNAFHGEPIFTSLVVTHTGDDFAVKTEPMAFNYYATGAYLLPRFNTGLVIASSKMKRGYIMEIVDLDTKAQAIEAGAHPRDQKALDGKMEELAKGLQEKVLTLR